ncbi:MAG: LPS export ABC transporter periplasmic protein LptC [Deltaproteobacteria bacterium]|jgi:LPS export ABC transporter protein LptC
MKNIFGKGPSPRGRFGWLWIVASVAILGLGVWKFWGPRPAPPTPKPMAAVQHPRMEGLALTEIQDGDKRWVLAAKRADFHQDQGTISISGVRVEFFGPEEDIRVKADEGLFHTKTRVLTLKGQVEMKRGDLIIRTDEATYLPSQRVLLAPGEVEITEPRLKVEGKDVRVELAAKKLIIAQHRLTEVQVQKWKVEQ